MADGEQGPIAPSGDARRSGGRALYEKHGSEHMRRIGERGRATIREKYGLRYYSEIAQRRRRDRRDDADSAA
jgi:hypothetical protein